MLLDSRWSWREKLLAGCHLLRAMGSDYFCRNCWTDCMVYKYFSTHQTESVYSKSLMLRPDCGGALLLNIAIKYLERLDLLRCPSLIVCGNMISICFRNSWLNPIEQLKQFPVNPLLHLSALIAQHKLARIPYFTINHIHSVTFPSSDCGCD